MKYLILPVLLFVSFHLLAQTQVRDVFCGNEIFSDMIRRHYPGLQDAFDATFENAKNVSPQRRNETLVVNVVVHVVWKEDEENLHDSIILDQIQVLNEDYNRLNSDTSELRAIFKSEAGAGNIQFELAEIIRVQTDQLFAIDLLGGTLLPEVKYDADGGSDARDPDAYLNIWITKIQPIELFGIVIGQILGFAFPPNGLDHWPEGVSAPVQGEDGVVLDYRTIGRNNPHLLENPVNGDPVIIRGRTATHEVGHYLGLRHIWGDGSEFGPNDCQQSDGIDDTPYADAQSATDCDKQKNSCPKFESHYHRDMPDLIENYMDYASEDCMNMFTHGQIDIMRNVLTGPRSGLTGNVLSISGLSSPSPFTIAPNPASHFSNLRFTVTDPAWVNVRISDINGRGIWGISQQKFNSGTHEITIDTKDFISGIYFVELRSTEIGSLIENRSFKMLLIN